MKKYLFIALAATALVSCSQDETLDNVQGEAIKFGGGFIENATRATSIGYTKDNLKQFTLFGTVTNGENDNNTVLLYNGETVTGTVGDNLWTGYSTHYWIDGANYKFAAVVDASTTNVDENNGMPTTLTYNLADQKDMLYDEVTTTGAANHAVVAFNFTHLVSKVYFTFASSMAENSEYKYKVSAIEIYSGLATSGTYACAEDGEGDWTLDATLTNTTNTEDNIVFGDICGNGDAESSDCTSAYLTADGLTSHNAKFVIPGEQTFNVRYVVDLYFVKDGKETLMKSETKTAENITVNFVKNHVYNIKGTIGVNNPIQFTVSEMGGWDEDTEEKVITVQ